MTLREYALSLGLKRSDTCKLFYGLYPYSLTGPIPTKIIEEYERDKLDFWKKLGVERRRLNKPALGWELANRSTRAIRLAFNDKVKSYLGKLIAKNADIFGEEDYFYTFSRSTITVYTKSPETTQRLLARNKKTFTRLCDPHNETSANYLAKADPKVLVRQNLFEGRFEYRIEFRSHGEALEALDTRVNTLRFGDSSYSYGFDSRILYLTGDDDLFLARLGLEDQIERITKCVAISDI